MSKLYVVSDHQISSLEIRLACGSDLRGVIEGIKERVTDLRKIEVHAGGTVVGSTKKIKVDFDTYEECIGWAVKYGLDLSKHSPSYYGATKKWQWEWEISALDDDHKTPEKFPELPSHEAQTIFIQSSKK